jgi:hypothetical protein
MSALPLSAVIWQWHQLIHLGSLSKGWHEPEPDRFANSFTSPGALTLHDPCMMRCYHDDCPAPVRCCLCSHLQGLIGPGNEAGLALAAAALVSYQDAGSHATTAVAHLSFFLPAACACWYLVCRVLQTIHPEL